jgi:hypothetical protein
VDSTEAIAAAGGRYQYSVKCTRLNAANIEAELERLDLRPDTDGDDDQSPDAVDGAHVNACCKAPPKLPAPFQSA